MKKSALITGISGQDGSYLAEYLLEKKYDVFGTAKPGSDKSRIAQISDKITIVEADMSDEHSLVNAMRRAQPDEVYNFAAFSFPQSSWQEIIPMSDTTALGVSRILEAIRKTSPQTRYYQASTSELFGKAITNIQNENTPFRPRNPYGVAKLYGYWITVNYRERYGIHASNGIAFNHESPRRGMEYVTRKITHGVARIHRGISKEIVLGNLDARRDWGFAGDYVKAMWLMLQKKNPDDYVIATGETHSVKDVVETAFEAAGIKNWEKYVKIDRSLVRPPEEHTLCGDSSKAKAGLGWKPEVSFRKLITMMVESDIQLLGKK